MEHIGKIVFLLLALLLLRAMPAHAQEDLTSPDSVPEIPLFTDTLVVDTIVTNFEENDETDAMSEETQIQFDIDTLYWGRDSMSLVRFYGKLDQLLKTRQGNLQWLRKAMVRRLSISCGSMG